MGSLHDKVESGKMVQRHQGNDRKANQEVAKGKGIPRGEKQMAANKEARRRATVQPKIRSPGSLDQFCLPWESHPRMQRQPNHTKPTTSSSKDGSELVAGLRNHLKAMGQEMAPEVEAFLMQKTLNSAQTIKAASQKIEAAQKAINKHKTEIAQCRATWTKFQEAITKEYDVQLEKFKERMSTAKEALQRAEEEYTEAKKTLKDAAEAHGTPSQEEELQGATATKPEGDDSKSKSPKRTREPNCQDPLAKKLREEVVISDEEMIPDGVDAREVLL